MKDRVIFMVSADIYSFQSIARGLETRSKYTNIGSLRPKLLLHGTMESLCMHADIASLTCLIPGILKLS